MWNPRRLLLLLTLTVVLVGLFIAYFRFLGSIDGLPELPVDYRAGPEVASPAPTPRSELPTKEKLRRAFGPTSPEATDNGQLYKLQTQLTDKGIVLACGQPQIAPAAEPSKKVVVAPFSMASFGKPKAPGEPMLPDEIEEITTLSADKAILEFDQPILSPQDMFTKAKLVGFEMVSTPDVMSTDTRSGKIWLTNNQKNRDSGQFLIFSTVGPVYYRTPESTPANADIAHIWTSAPVEVIDRRNLPRSLRSTVVTTSATRGDELRNRGTVAAILHGELYPPPTITAEGMRIYLMQQEKKPNAKQANTTGYSGVRMVELVRKVQFNQWTENDAGFPGTTPAQKPATPAARTDPPAALGAAFGGSADAAAVATKLNSRSLLVVETAGLFRHDFTKNLARFESEDGGDPNAPNHVSVTRLSADDKQDNLFCKLLLVQFDGPIAGTQPTPVKPEPGKPLPGNPSGEGMKIKSLHATGPHVFVSVEREQLLAQGTELRYEVNGRESVTTLRGTPVVAVREKNRLQTGSTAVPGEIKITSLEPALGSKDAKTTTITVNGAGTIDLLDGATGANTVRAIWGKSLHHERSIQGKLEQDLLKFEGGAEFIDLKANMTLTADRIWLWLAPPGDQPGQVRQSKAGPQQAVPQRLDAVGRVVSKSPELIIEKTDQLKLWFRDVPPPVFASAVPVEPVKPMAGDKPAVPAPSGSTPLPEPKVTEKEKPKPPIVLSARAIESWLVRYPVAAPKPAIATTTTTTTPVATPALKYEMERAVCDDRVIVHQDPTDPKKNPRGLDIAGERLTLEAIRVNSELGQKMTVFAAAGNFAEVKFESLSLYGPQIDIDQINNTVAVNGPGSLLMPSSTDLGGNATDTPNVLDIKWMTSMFFNGAKGTAEFLGRVAAVQRPDREGLVPRPPTTKVAVETTWNQSRLICHRLDCTFDKPIYFNQFKRDDDKPAKPGDPPREQAKLQSALALPVPDDEVAGKAAPIRIVTYTDETYTPGKMLVKAQRIDAQEISVRMREKMQEIFAAGPGEVRMLQSDNSEWGTPATPAGTPPPKTTAEGTMKLTHVKFVSRMTAIDKNKLFQEATFENGANVWQIPTNNINLNYVAHALPVGSTTISCVESLKVSTSRSQPAAPAEQWMVAKGNAEFGNDDYEGHGGTITADGRTITLKGTGDRLANIYRRKQSLNDRQGTRAKTIVYLKDGTITATEGGSGVFIP